MKNSPIPIASLIIAGVLLSFGWGLATAEERFKSSRFLTFEHEAIERKYLLYLPNDLPENAPLVFVLHGYRGDARGYTELGMNRLADAHRFAVCYPQGDKLLPTATLARLTLTDDWQTLSPGFAILESITRPRSLPEKFPFPDPDSHELRDRPAGYGYG